MTSAKLLAANLLMFIVYIYNTANRSTGLESIDLHLHICRSILSSALDLDLGLFSMLSDMPHALVYRQFGQTASLMSGLDIRPCERISADQDLHHRI